MDAILNDIAQFIAGGGTTTPSTGSSGTGSATSPTTTG